jgi:hypothetical protein
MRTTQNKHRQAARRRVVSADSEWPLGITFLPRYLSFCLLFSWYPFLFVFRTAVPDTVRALHFPEYLASFETLSWTFQMVLFQFFFKFLFESLGYVGGMTPHTF